MDGITTAAISHSTDVEEPTTRLTRAIADRLRGIVDGQSERVEQALAKRRKKWRKRCSRNKLIGSASLVVYTPVDETVLAEKEDVLYEFEDKVHQLLKLRKTYSAAVRQLEQERLQNRLEILVRGVAEQYATYI